LFNKGVVKRHQAYVREIGTKKQYKVSTGQFVVSKIDGKSGAFGIVPNVLDGSVVTHDFMVFDINKSIINPLYLELVMNNEDFLSQFKENSSGSTGRKRLSKESFLNTRIGLPTLDEQNEMLQQISSIIEEQESLKRQLDASIGEFYKKVFD
jgi:restriction endonuclease S subunit